MVTGCIYHSEIPKTAQCETRERAKRAVGRNETRYSARRFMGGNGEGDRTERGMERRRGQRGPVEERDRVCVAGQPHGSRSRGPTSGRTSLT